MFFNAHFSLSKCKESHPQGVTHKPKMRKLILGLQASKNMFEGKCLVFHAHHCHFSIKDLCFIGSSGSGSTH